jgi:hypothetical protein
MKTSKTQICHNSQDYKAANNFPKEDIFSLHLPEAAAV